MAKQAKVVTLNVAGQEAIVCLFEANGTKNFSIVSPQEPEAQAIVLDAINAFIDMPEADFRVLAGMRKDFRVTEPEAPAADA